MTTRASNRQAGVSLIELMIAMVIGILLLIGLIQIFSASRQAYVLSQAVARNQENSRFALDTLSRDIRMGGHTGCINDQALKITNGGDINSLFLAAADRTAGNEAAADSRVRFDASVQGYEANGTGLAGTLALATAPVLGATTDWSPGLPAYIAALQPVKGSDILILRYLSPIGVPITAYNFGSPTTVTYATANKDVAQGGNGMYALSDCLTTTVFQATAAPSTTTLTIGTAGKNLSTFGQGRVAEVYHADQAELYRAESVVFFVGINPAGLPSLYRAKFGLDTAGAWVINREEQVEGVDSLQLLYGQDSAAATASRPTGYINNMAVASDATLGDLSTDAKVTAWRRIGSIQVGLVMRSTGEAARVTNADEQRLRVLGVTVTTPADGQYRAGYTTTVAMRNRLFGN